MIIYFIMGIFLLYAIYLVGATIWAFFHPQFRDDFIEMLPFIQPRRGEW